MNNDRTVYSVKQVNLYIKQIVDNDPYLRSIFVKGEVSNCKYHYSGHVYFSLKDESGVISVIMFASNASRMNFRLKDGMQVIVGGNISVFERDGKYQLYARTVQETGTGELYARFEALKNKLEEMGMFSPEYKQPIPAFSMNIGVVTAQTGAVIKDIYNVASRRNPYCQIILAPAQVQGAGSAESIKAGIERLDRLGLDVIIVGRGGGSIEDLWCFNEELVARAIFDCRTPVISAVGHETDFTIADFVADLRAPTPSAAAELAVFDYSRFLQDLDTYRSSLDNLINSRVETFRNRLNHSHLKLETLSPQHQLNERKHYLEAGLQKLNMIISDLCRDRKNELGIYSMDLDSLIEGHLNSGKEKLGIFSERLNGLSPLKRLSEGYSFTSLPSGKRLSSISQIKCGDIVNIDLSDGQVRADVTEIKERYIGERL